MDIKNENIIIDPEKTSNERKKDNNSIGSNIIKEKENVIFEENRYDWSYFDSIRCINLVSRDDRYEHCQEIFKKYDIPVEFYRTEKNKEDPWRGCFESHINIISEAVDKGCSNILIFEDDIVPNNRALDPKSLNTAIEFMQNNTEWDIFYFGARPIIELHTTSRIDPKSRIQKVRSSCTHAYILSRRMMEKMYKMKYAEAEIDAIYLRNRKAYTIYPSFFQQGAFDSDINGVGFVGKDYAMQAIESYSYYVNFPLVSLILLLLVLIILLLLANVNILYILVIIIILIILIILSPPQVTTQ